MNAMRGIDGQPGLKARQVIARPEGRGCETTTFSRGLKGRSDDCAANVPPLQGGRQIAWACSRAFSPGFHIAGLQPYSDGVLKLSPISHRGNVNEIIGKFGGADRLRNAVNQLQTLIYAA
jgi:hypothetical protein